MKLIDAFIPVFEYFQILGPELMDDSSKNVESVMDEILALLEISQRQAVAKYYTQNQFDIALFAICSFIDEKILDSDWKYSDEWVQSSLQKRFFNTCLGGTLFFKKLDKLNSANTKDQDIREVYLYCLRQGFSGCYFDIGEQSKLKEIIQANYLMLVKEQDIKLFDVIIPSKSVQPTSDYPLNKVKDLISVWGPLLGVILIFLYLRNDLLNSISIFVNGI